MLFIDIMSLFINWANKDACLLVTSPARQENGEVMESSA